ncbi:MAG: NADH-quinone oxidoreductase subunit K [Candidatus Sumerlaeaceae bacterium]
MFFLFILPVAAAEVAIGLALGVLLQTRYGTLDLWQIAQMRED